MGVVDTGSMPKGWMMRAFQLLLITAAISVRVAIAQEQSDESKIIFAIERLGGTVNKNEVPGQEGLSVTLVGQNDL